MNTRTNTVNKKIDNHHDNERYHEIDNSTDDVVDVYAPSVVFISLLSVDSMTHGHFCFSV